MHWLLGSNYYEGYTARGTPQATNKKKRPIDQVK